MVVNGTIFKPRVTSSSITGLPIEFFKLAPRSVSRRIYGMVMGYMNVDSNTENHIMRLEKPYYFEGKQYTEIDLNGVADAHAISIQSIGRSIELQSERAQLLNVCTVHSGHRVSREN